MPLLPPGPRAPTVVNSARLMARPIESLLGWRERDRFLDARTSTYTWLPFGGGIRRCIGASLAEAEIAEVMRVVLSRVQLRAIRPKPDPVVMRGITLLPVMVCKSRSRAGPTVALAWAPAFRGRRLDRGATGAYPSGGEFVLQPARV